MAACDTPFYVLPKAGTEKVPVPCGKCPPCKLKRINGWVFRLLQEEKNYSHSHFITLTYGTESIPITQNGFRTLDKGHLRNFWKRLRKRAGTRLKYYACGEYGTARGRPHYHAIVFGCSNPDAYQAAWSLDEKPLGSVFVGAVSGDSIAYTAKYINKPPTKAKHARDDREREFSVMSKGLGKAYITEEIKAYHKADLSRMYLTKPGGHTIGLPRYYRDKIFTEAEQLAQRPIVLLAIEASENDLRRKYEEIYGISGNPRFTFEQFKESLKYGRYKKFYSSPDRKDP